MELSALLDQMQADGSLARIANNPAVQFGSARRRYLGAEILPERPVTVNQYRETRIKYRSPIANHGSRYSPSTRKNGKLVGHFDVVMSDSAIGDEFSAADYDRLILMLQPLTGPVDQSVPAMTAVAQVEQWVNAAVNIPLVELNELMRWQALVDRVVKLRGDNGYSEDITLPSFDDLTINAADWTDDTKDPFTDIAKIVTAMAARGITPVRIITGRDTVAKMSKNALVRARTGRVVVNTAGQIKGTIGFTTIQDINSALTADGLPPIEVYDLQYATQTGGDYFLKRKTMVIIGATDSSEVIDLGDGQFETIEGVLGYTAVGRGAGRAAPGRYIRTEAKDNLPPSLIAEGWQSSMPVLLEPEAVGVINLPA